MGRTLRARTAAVMVGTLLAALAAPVAMANGNRLPDGFHDAGAGTVKRGECVAAGWAVDQDSPYERVAIRISVDGSAFTTTVADQFRQDLVDAGVSPDGNSSFTVYLGALGVGFDVAHEVLIEAQDVQTAEWKVLENSPRAMLCSNAGGYHDGNAGLVARSDCLATGWATDWDTPGTAVAIRIRVDGKVVAETMASEFRDSPDPGVLPDGPYGFTVNIFRKLSPNVRHTISIEMRDSSNRKLWVPLWDTDKQLTCVSDTTPAVQGTYSYASELGARSVTLDARLAGPTKGTFSFTNLVTGVTRTGSISCLIVDGREAWLAGRETWTNGDPGDGMFFHVYDGGAPGPAADQAISLVGIDGSFENDVLPLCTNRDADWALYPLDSGELVVSGSR